MKLAISVGDVNGVGLEIALDSHHIIKEYCEPIYCINRDLLNQASLLLNRAIDDDFKIVEVGENFKIEPSKVRKNSGRFSFESFEKAIKLAKSNEVEAIVTLPINKESWFEAGVKYRGHTEALRDFFQRDAIMMLGCDKMFVALYSEHIPFREVMENIKEYKLTHFLITLFNELKVDNIAVLGINPHCGDGGVLGDEDDIIRESIKKANSILKQNIFKGPIVPDTAFTPRNREQFKYFVAMYHDQGLAPLKALYFDESINVSLNLPIIRVSVDHGTAFDIAYRDAKPDNQSYINAVKEAINLAKKRLQ